MTNRKKPKRTIVTLSTYHFLDGYSCDVWLSFRKGQPGKKKRVRLGPDFTAKQALVQGITTTEEMVKIYAEEYYKPRQRFGFTSNEERLEFCREEITEHKMLLARLEQEGNFLVPIAQEGCSVVYMTDDYITIKSVERAIMWMLKKHYNLPVVTLKWDKRPKQRLNWEEDYCQLVNTPELTQQ